MVHYISTGCRDGEVCSLRWDWEIDVPELMEAYNRYILSGDVKAMIDRIRLYWGMDMETNAVHNCNECGICETLCTQKLPIRERLTFIRQKIQEFLASQKD